MKKYRKLKHGTVKNMNGEFYVPETEINDLVIDKEVVPVYSAKCTERELISDSPYCGMEEYGPPKSTVEGPFYDEIDIDRIIEEKGRGINDTKRFSAEKIIQLYNPSDLPFVFETFIKRQYLIRAYIDDYKIKMGKLESSSRNESAINCIEEMINMIPQFASDYTGSIAEKSKDYRFKRKDGNIIGVLDEILFEVKTSCYKSEGPGTLEHSSVELITFSKFLDQEVSGLFIEHTHSWRVNSALHAIKETEFKIKAPTPELSLNYNSIDEFISVCDFIG